MIWLASYPRSGNTFLRIVLDTVFGVSSGSFHVDEETDPGYERLPVVKTHEPAHRVVPADTSIPAVCLVRDGRDAMVSLAHYHKDLLDPESSFEANLEGNVRADGGESHFGGWSHNIRSWLDRGATVVRYEDLIEDPIGQVERLGALIDLPEPRAERLPTFEELKTEQRLYGSGSVRITGEPEIARKFFRRGRSGAWRKEMPDDLHRVFWSIHGDMMRELGYTDGMPARKGLLARLFLRA